jgi:hypothetical protein
MLAQRSTGRFRRPGIEAVWEKEVKVFTHRRLSDCPGPAAADDNDIMTKRLFGITLLYPKREGN